MKQNKVEKSKKDAAKIIRAFKSYQDPNGSYTGNNLNFEKPVQDADDL